MLATALVYLCVTSSSLRDEEKANRNNNKVFDDVRMYADLGRNQIKYNKLLCFFLPQLIINE